MHPTTDVEGRWIIEWARPDGWSPYTFDGPLELHRDGKRWSATVSFRQSSARFEATSIAVHDEDVHLVFADTQGGTVALDLTVDGDTIHGTAWWKDPNGNMTIRRSVVDGERAWGPIAADVTAPWPTASAAEVGLSADGVAELVELAQYSHSGGLVVVKDGRLVVAAGTSLQTRTNVASVSKAISSLAVPFLIDEQKWTLERPLGDAFPAWKDDPRGQITIANALTHTTGLDVPDDYPTWIDGARADMAASVLAAPLERPPGTSYAYSNRSAELTPMLVAAVTGEQIDAYLLPRLLRPLGIEGVTWSHDGKGLARAHAGMGANALDLATIGAMLADGGTWNGQQVVPRAWIDSMTQAPFPEPASQAGLGWFLLPDGGFQHTGDSGAFLMVLPEQHLVCARVHVPADRGDERKREVHYAVGALMRECAELVGVTW